MYSWLPRRDLGVNNRTNEKLTDEYGYLILLFNAASVCGEDIGKEI